MIRYCILLISFSAAFIAPKTTQAQDQILGIFWTPKKDGKIELFRVGQTYFGKLIWGKANKKDLQNPNPALRNRELVGTMILFDFKYDDGEWSGGKIYDPESGKTYSCKIWLEQSGRILKAKGYIGISVFGRTETFERVQ